MAWERGSSFACRISFLNLRFSCEGPNVSFKLKFLEVVNKLTDETVQKFSYEWTWLLKLINNSLRKYKGNQCLMSVWKSDETLLSICILNFSFKSDFVWEEISNIRHSVSSPDETPRSSSKILRCASYFQLSSRCFIWWWNTASHVWYITWNYLIFLCRYNNEPHDNWKVHLVT